MWRCIYIESVIRFSRPSFDCDVYQSYSPTVSGCACALVHVCSLCVVINSIESRSLCKHISFIYSAVLCCAVLWRVFVRDIFVWHFISQFQLMYLILSAKVNCTDEHTISINCTLSLWCIVSYISYMHNFNRHCKWKKKSPVFFSKKWIQS